LQNAVPLDAIVPTALSLPNIGTLPPGPAPEAPAGLVLTPVQLATLTSGDPTSVNQLLSQLVGGGNLSGPALTTLVDTLLAPQPQSPATPASNPTPTVTTTGTPAGTAAGSSSGSAPIPTNPINYVSRS
jgi:hypothetical protein